MNSWDDKKVRDALKANGKNKVVVSGLWTEVCNNSFSLCAILEGGYEIYMVADASGGTSKEAHDYAMQRMIQVGVIPVTWQQVMLEWQRDWARNLRSLWYGRGLRLHDGAQVAAAHINKDARGASPCRRVTRCSRGSPYILLSLGVPVNPHSARGSR
jgi:hypothetical protein